MTWIDALPSRRSHALGVLLSLLTLLPVPLRADTPPPYEARLTQSVGDVTLRAHGTDAKGAPLFNVTPLEEGDWIMTRRGASADISFTNGTLVRLMQGSAVGIKRVSSQDTLLILAYGTLLAKVQFEKGVGMRFVARTPNGIATVQGTEFVVEEDGSRAYIGVLDEGHVAARVPGFKKEVVMHFNQETVTRRGRPPADAKVLEHLYHYKTQMAEIRSHLKVVRKEWKKIGPARRQRIRAAWVRKNTPPPPRRSRRRSARKSIQR